MNTPQLEQLEAMATLLKTRGLAVTVEYLRHLTTGESTQSEPQPIVVGDHVRDRLGHVWTVYLITLPFYHCECAYGIARMTRSELRAHGE
jgi:hypothetical protein